MAGFSGLGQGIADNDTAHTIFGFVGGVVLIAFGVVSVVRTFRPVSAEESSGATHPRLVLWSFLAVVTNAKALSLYALFVPTLTETGLSGWRLYTAFALVHVILLLCWLAAVGLVMRVIPVLGRSGTARNVLVALTAVFLVVLGGNSIVHALGGMDV